MNRLDETGVGSSIHNSVLAYEVALLQEHIDTNDMSEFSRMVNLAVMQYFIDRIEIVTGETNDPDGQ